MRKEPLFLLEKYRIKGIEKSVPFMTDYIMKNKGNTGVFEFRQPGSGKRLFVLSSDSCGWDHISVHIPKKGKKQPLPTWDDMCFVKAVFFDEEEVVCQFHPRETEYVNVHPGTLHLWKYQGADFPTPPLGMI